MKTTTYYVRKSERDYELVEQTIVNGIDVKETVIASGGLPDMQQKLDEAIRRLCSRPSFGTAR